MRVWLFRVGALLAILIALGAVQHLRLSPASTLPVRADGDLRVATWNVHYILTNQPEGRWGLSGWQDRRDPMNATFGALDADIVAFQEMESFAGSDDDTMNLARAWLLENNPGYAAAAIGDWRDFPSTQPIFYRTARLQLLDQGWFFFSDTPDVIYSRSFDGRYPAFGSWARFHDPARATDLRVVNVHFDAGSRLNRRLSADLVGARIAPWIADGETVVLAGDLNAFHGSRLHQVLQDAGIIFPGVPSATYHFDRGLNLLPAIDFIGITPSLAVVDGPFAYVDPEHAPRPSDHYPLVLDLQ